MDNLQEYNFQALFKYGLSIQNKDQRDITGFISIIMLTFTILKYYFLYQDQLYYLFWGGLILLITPMINNKIYKLGFVSFVLIDILIIGYLIYNGFIYSGLSAFISFSISMYSIIRVFIILVKYNYR